MSALIELLGDYTLRTVALGSALLGITSGVLGSFAVLRRQGLLGDVLSHAALPGVCLAFLLTGTRTPAVLLAGAAVSCWLGAAALFRVVEETRVSEDSAMGIVLSVFFGFGIVLLTFISKRGDAAQAGLNTYLFGQAATLVWENVVTMAALGLLAIAAVVLWYKEFKLLAFDPEFATSLGYNTRRLGLLLTSVTVVAIVIGLQTVGVVLMAAMLVGPAVAARQWTSRLSRMLVVAALVGALSGLSGALISMSQPRLPTGPMIILSLTALVVVSLLLAPERGLLWERRHRRGRRRDRGPEASGDGA
ncbi:MAG: iron chelate uptake ABC transporter family permease subunit [Armatimonadota bacterium]|nr:iron chelate uptake ABC transporter family permease subunit [Armatimonadota bacterium]